MATHVRRTLAQLERLYLDNLTATRDGSEAVAEFEKRSPRWTKAQSLWREMPITFDVEIVLRERDYAVTERVAHRGNDPGRWTEQDVEVILKEILLAIDRVKNPNARDRYVALRGFSWIVEPTSEGVVIAIEIPSGAAVAGPFRIDQLRLDRLITRVIAVARLSRPVVH
jgi:hypothetical protein